MSSGTVDNSSSSVVSEPRKIEIISRDGDLCVLCGVDPVEVAQIIGTKSGYGKVNWIRQMAPPLSDFSEDDAENLICLCPTHRRQFDSGRFVLVPSERQRELLLEHEHRDFALREEILAHGGGDPGRTFPQLIDEFEYIPVQTGPYRMYIHNPTPYDPSLFPFDTMDSHPAPLLHFRASHIALMVDAQPCLSSACIIGLRTPKGLVAEPQISTLLGLYRRQPGNPRPAVSIPDEYKAFFAQLGNSIGPHSAPLFVHVPSSPHTMNAAPHPSILSKDGPVPGFAPSSLASTDDSSQIEDADVDIYAGVADKHLMEYAKEPSITWEDLKSRPPLSGGEELGPWRFASADDICRQWL